MSGTITVTNQKKILDARLLMESDLGMPHTAASLAKKVDLSQFYFQRLFRKIVNESVAEHLRRLRLESAAELLRASQMTVSEVSASIGFRTHAGFTHAFRKFFDCSPQEYRIRCEESIARQERPTEVLKSVQALTVFLDEFREQQFVVLRHDGPTEKIPQIWKTLIRLVPENLRKKETKYVGIYRDGWETDSNSYRYDACISVPSEYEPPAPLSKLTLPAGLVAQTVFQGSLKSMDKVWQDFYQRWLPTSNFELRTPYVFDIYPEQLITGSALSQILKTLRGISARLCIPVSQLHHEIV